MQKNLAKQAVYKYKVNIGSDIDNYEWKVLLLNILKIQLILVAMRKYELHSYLSDENEQDACDSHVHMVNIFKNICIGNISVWYVNSMGRNRWFCQAI